MAFPRVPGYGLGCGRPPAGSGEPAGSTTERHDDVRAGALVGQIDVDPQASLRQSIAPMVSPRGPRSGCAWTTAAPPRPTPARHRDRQATFSLHSTTRGTAPAPTTVPRRCPVPEGGDHRPCPSLTG